MATFRERARKIYYQLNCFWYGTFCKGLKIRGRCYKRISRYATVKIDDFLPFNQDLDFRFRGGAQSKLLVDEGCSLIVGKENIFGSNAKIEVFNGATLSIGSNGYFNSDCTLIVRDRVTIGKGSIFSQNVIIRDSDVHTVDNRCNHAPITIGDHCWIGTNVIILKGVTIGDGAVIGAGSVVTKSIPAHALAVGNPARVIRENITWKV